MVSTVPFSNRGLSTRLGTGTLGFQVSLCRQNGLPVQNRRGSKTLFKQGGKVSIAVDSYFFTNSGCRKAGGKKQIPRGVQSRIHDKFRNSRTL